MFAQSKTKQNIIYMNKHNIWPIFISVSLKRSWYGAALVSELGLWSILRADWSQLKCPWARHKTTNCSPGVIAWAAHGTGHVCSLLPISLCLLVCVNVCLTARIELNAEDSFCRCVKTQYWKYKFLFLNIKSKWISQNMKFAVFIWHTFVFGV